MAFSDRLADIGQIGSPDFNAGGGDISNILGRILPYIEQSRDNELRRKKELFNFQSQGRLSNITHSRLPQVPQAQKLARQALAAQQV